MRILLIGNKETSENPEEYYKEYQAFFSQAAIKSTKEVTVVFTLFDDLIISVGDGDFTIFNTRESKDLSNYDAILIRGKGFRNYFDVVKTISIYAKLNGHPIINDYSFFRDSSKLAQAVQFHQENILVAKTVFVNHASLADPKAAGIKFPCVMKATFGAHGNDNYLVNSTDEARQIAKDNIKTHFVFQRFIPNNGDYRILIVGNEILVFERRAVEGSHLNNTSQGGTAAMVDVSEMPKDVIDDAKKITRALDMTFSGVDVLQDSEDGKYYFLEVNSQPQLMSGAYIEEKAATIARYFDSL